MTDEVMNPQDIARSIAVETSERSDAVGDFVSSTDIGDGVTDFRFESKLVGYEGWQWSVTLYHDLETERWTVNESTLIPTDDSLLPPPWIPWKDRLKPSDLSVMDSIGTEEDDSRLEDGFRPVNHQSEDELSEKSEEESKEEKENSEENTLKQDGETAENADATETVENEDSSDNAQNNESSENNDSNEDLEEAVSTLRLSRRRVMTAEALSQTAKRWYAGQHGPKSLSTKIADGNVCSSCGFMIPLAGSLGSMFGVCANMWSPDDGRVVSLDHACGEHSEIEPPEPSQLWIQSAPAYDDYHIDILQQAPREERADVELIEEAIEDSKTHRRKRRKLNKDAANDANTADTVVIADADITDTTSTDTADSKTADLTSESNDVDSHDVESNYEDETKTEEIKKIEVTEESAKSEEPNKNTGTTAMRLYKRKSRRQHK
ncbi:hypothetical protein AXE76_01510 [Gardnerella vaginalis]|uniref:DUF3027 domain-containing protein n=1 Tax=Gardnerella vaginalis TaxID=2702 RepID=A0A3E1IPM3_GARVA|nr:DUF3027 domain-containing protein [Gardnerella vaginalis]RFD74917.1 hypothetical protein AXE76_01510 [Gardnerella vaginalis]